MDYRRVDKGLERLKKKLRREVNRIDVIGLDELNAPRITKETKAMMDRLLKNNEEEYIGMAKDGKAQAKEDLKESGYEPEDFTIDEKWLLLVLASYNPITEYLYYPEADRKRLRLAEGLNTARAILSSDTKHNVLRKFANLWFKQTSQYGVDVTDEAYLQSLEKTGVKYVQWLTEKDEKVCSVCRERDNKVYPIGNIPTKPHYNCRCTLRPMPKDYKDTNGES